MENTKSCSIGLLVLRIGLGIAFILHGLPKLQGGPELWEGLGSAMEMFGIGFAPVFWGFMAAFTEFIGGFLLIMGLLVRPASVFLLITMVVATFKLGAGADPGFFATFKAISHPFSLAIVFLALVFLGPGRYSLSGQVPRMNNKWYS